MGRKRRRCNEHLPKGVYRKGAGFIYRRAGKDTYLCKQTDPASMLWAAYERAYTAEKDDTLKWLVEAYLESDRFKKLAPRTREAYGGYAATLLAFRTRAGQAFGDVRLEAITPISIRGFLDRYPAPISANRQIQFLKAAWNWARQRHVIPDNPCAGVTLNEQKPRKRYVSAEEYAAALQLATGYLPAFMEMAYLCRARRSEVGKLRESDIVADGVRLERGKGSEGEITAWTPRLRAAVAMCRAINPDAPVPIHGKYLIHDKAGLPIKKNAFDSAWRRLMDKVIAAGGESFTYHDLKAAGYSDQREQWAGHRSERMHKVYSRKLRIVEPPG